MDYCEFCLDSPQPIECTLMGTVLLDGTDGERRLLGELEVAGPARIHYVQVRARQRTWLSGERVLYAITVYNASSLPLSRVTVTGGGGDFLEGTVRLDGLPLLQSNPTVGVELAGLGPGCEAMITWQEGVPQDGILRKHPAGVVYEYRFGDRDLGGETCV